MIIHRSASDNITDGITTTYCGIEFGISESDEQTDNDTCNCPECLEEYNKYKPKRKMKIGIMGNGITPVDIKKVLELLNEDGIEGVVVRNPQEPLELDYYISDISDIPDYHLPLPTKPAPFRRRDYKKKR